MYVAEFFDPGRRDFLVVLESVIRAAVYDFADDYPRVVVAENTAVLFVSRRL